jgi:hypothetical protein
MALTETKAIDKIEVLENGVLQVREATRIMRDGEEIAKTYHRWAFPPGSDLTGQPANVQAIAQAAWTPEVIAAYQQAQADAAQRMGA